MENHDHHTQDSADQEDRRPFSPLKGAAAMVGVIAAVFILREHWGHVLGFLPYALLLACPLMHIFMHGGHGHHHGHDDKK